MTTEAKNGTNPPNIEYRVCHRTKEKPHGLAPRRATCLLVPPLNG